MLHSIHAPLTKRDCHWYRDDEHDEDSYPKSPKRGALLRSSNLTVAGFPSSLQPYDFACFPSDLRVKHGSDPDPNGNNVQSQITMGFQKGRCERTGASEGSTFRNSSEDRFKDERCAVDRLGKEALTARLATDAVQRNDGEVDGGIPPRPREIGRSQCTEDETRASPLSNKPLKFGIEAILSIGAKKQPEKKINLSDYKHRIVGRWNGEPTSKATNEQYEQTRGRLGGSKRAVAACSIQRSWSNTSPRPPLSNLAMGNRWECLPGVGSVEAGRVGWAAREICSEYHKNYQSRYIPYPWTRTSDPTIHHCYPLQPTLPPSHPTLPRSFHQAASVPSMVPEGGLDVKGNLGGSGGMVPSLSGNHKRKRSWSRAVFTSLQRKGLEKRFEIQKYVNKPERRQLASALGLSDAQVKVWFQNRRMKWRHTQQFNRSRDTIQGQTGEIPMIQLGVQEQKQSEESKNTHKDPQIQARRIEHEENVTFEDSENSDEESNQQ